MRKRMALNGLALLGLLASTNVLAEIQPGFYAGVGVGTATVELDTNQQLGGFTFDSDDTAFKVFGGYNFNQYFAIEATYFDGGNPEETLFTLADARGTLEVGVSGLSAAAIGRVPLGEVFALYGKLGLASYDAEITGRLNGDVVEDGEAEVSDDDVVYGVGAAFNVGSQFELRAEYEAISFSDGDFTLLSVSGLFKF